MAIKLIPEIALHKVLRGLIALMKVDYNSFAADKKSNTILHDLFYGIKLEQYDFYNNAIQLFTLNDSRRRLELSIGFNMERLDVPTIHIILPSEVPVSSPIGGNEGYEDEYSGFGSDGITPVKAAVYTYENQVTYNLLITSGNPLETIMIYNWLKYCFVSINPHMELSGFRNLKFGGSDLNFDESLMPNNVFHRNFNLTFDYEYFSRDFNARGIGNKFIIEQILLADDQQTVEQVIALRNAP